MTLLKEKVQTILEKKIGEVRHAGLAATAQVRTQVTNRAIQILEAKAVDAETVHPKTVHAAVKKGIVATAKHAEEVVNKDVVYMVKAGRTENMGLVFGLEMAGNIDKLAYETLIGLALSNGVTDEYPASVSKLKGMAAIEDGIISALQELATKKEYKLTIGAYIVEFTAKEIDGLTTKIRAICKKARNGAEKVMTQYLENKAAAEAQEAVVVEENNEQPVTTNTVEEATTEQPVVEEVVVEAVPEPTRYAKNIKCIAEYVRGLNLGADIAEAIMAQIIADNKERLETVPFTNKLADLVTPVVQAAVDKLFPAPTETPANGETPAAETNKESEEKVVVEEQATLEKYKQDIAQLKEFAAELENSYKQHVTDLINANNAIIKQYDDKLAEYDAKILDASQKFQYMEDENAKLKKELEIAKKDLIKQTTLRKADAHKITKLEKEVGRVKVTLKEHKARQVSEDKVTKVPEGVDVGAVIKSRIKTAGALDKAAQAIHEKAPEKLEAAADKTKDGIQWVADRAKDTVDVVAKSANWSTEKLGNTITLAADKIAPTTEAVAKSALRKTPAEGEKPFVIIGGNKFYKDADGTLHLGK